MKYIDAEKLTKAIEDKGLDCSFALKMERLDTLALIDELQQEQPEVDLEKEIDQLFEIVRGEDGLAHVSSLNGSICDDWKKSPYVINKPGFIHYAKHFYELGLNARKEE